MDATRAAASIDPAGRGDQPAGSSLIIREWHKRRDRRQQDAWPKPDHPFMAIWSTQRPAAGRRASWAIELAELDQVIGRVTLREHVGDVARLGIYLAPPWAGRGFGRAALRRFIGMSFGSLGLSRLLLDVAASNQRALMCYLALGFRVQDREWREISDDPALALLDLAEYAALRPFFAPGRALFYELALSAFDWTSYVL